jgi:hypothetical protein
MIRLIGAAVLLLALGASSPARAADTGEDATSLPSGVEPYEQPVVLRFRPVDHFIHAWLKTLAMGNGRATLIEGFEMRGSVRAQADLLLWTYKLYNLGRDGKLREMGEVEALTDGWGKVENVRILGGTLPSVPMRPGFYDLLDASHFHFPLCCLPRVPVRMGARVDLETSPSPAGSNDAKGPGKMVSDDRRSVAAGLLTKDSRRYLVLRLEGGVTFDIDGKANRSQQAGYTLIDTNNGLPYFEIKSLSIEVAAAKSLTVTMVNRRQSDY